MPVFSVNHTTVYRYARQVKFGEHRLMFRPSDSYDQRLLDHALLIDPQPSEVRWIHDVFGNCVAVIRFEQAAREFRFDTPSVSITRRSTRPISASIAAALNYPFAYDRRRSGRSRPDHGTALSRRGR